MKDEERKEEQVAPEVEAAWCRLMVGYLNLRGPIEGRSISGIKGGLNYLGRWLRIIEADDVAAAFRKQVLEDSGFWNKYAKAEVEPEVVVESEERPWEDLDITEEMWNRDLPDLLGSGKEETAIFNWIARVAGYVTVGPTLQLLNERKWERGAIRGIGPKRLALLREKFAGAGYPVPE